MLRQIVIIGMLFLVCGVAVGALAYLAVNKMAVSDHGVGTSGRAPR
jgi:ABC-type lipoprotein release transport system permease subunit